jgi:putative addiction module CopG family antidote
MKISLGKLAEWVRDQVKYGDYDTDSEVIREAGRLMEDEPVESAKLEGLMDEVEESGVRKMSPKDWDDLRRLAKTGMAK